MTLRLTLTVPEAGQLLGIGRRAAYEAARTGAIPTLPFGGRLVVPIPKLLELVGGTAGLDPELLRRVGITADTGQVDGADSETGPHDGEPASEDIPAQGSQDQHGRPPHIPSILRRVDGL